MAKPLKKPQPTSSAARFLKNASFEGALSLVPDGMRQEPNYTIEEQETEPEPQPQAMLEVETEPLAVVQPPPPVQRVAGRITPKPTAKPLTERLSSIEIVLSQETNEVVEELYSLFRENTGTNLNKSQLFRSLLRAVKYNMRGIEKQAAHTGALKRPSNNKGFEEDRELFEETIAQVFVRGMRG